MCELIGLQHGNSGGLKVPGDGTMTQTRGRVSWFQNR